MAGYDVERFVNPPQELIEYLCGICQKILSKPTQCKHCVTYFCQDCIKRKLCPNNCQKGKTDSTLYTINKYMKNKINNTLKIRCKYQEYGCTTSCLLKEIHDHEKDCCFSRIQASQLDDHIKKCDYQTVICSTCDFEILRKEEGKHDCVSRMLEHIKKCTEKNEELSEELKELQIRESEVKNKLDEMTTENNNITMRLTQKSEQYERENAMILHDISSVSTKSPQRTRQDEIDELNEFDNVTQYTVNNYAKKVENKITSHANEVNSEFERMQERLREHFKRFANRVRDRFEREVIHAGINQEFDKLSPIKKANTFDDERLETGESNHLSGVNESEEQELNDECLTAEMRETKNKLVKAYTSPLREYQTAIDTTAEFRKITKLEKDLEYMDPIQKLRKSERSTSLDQQRRREEMKKRLESSKMGQTMGNRGNNQDLAKSARLLNAFDTHDPYPENKFTINFVVPSVPQTVSVTPKEKSSSLSRIKSENVYGQNKVRRKKDELVKALLLNNRNR